MKMLIKKVLPVNIVIGIIIFSLFVIFSGGELTLITYGIALALVIGSFPSLISAHLRIKRLRQIEYHFPDFLRDLSEAKTSGMTLPKSISLVSKGRYGPLTQDIKKMSVQISWGVPFPKVLDDFRKRNADSMHISRAISIILAAQHSGGNISKVMDRVADTTRKLVDTEKERRSKLSSHVSVMYAIHFVFLGILIALYKFIVPLLELGALSATSIFATSVTLDYYRFLFFSAAVIQAVGNGLIIGVSRDGKFMAGAKYIMILVVATMIIFSIFILPKTVLLEIDPLSKTTFAVGEEISISGHFSVDNQPKDKAVVEVKCLDETSLARTNPDGFFSLTVRAPGQVGDIRCDVEGRYQNAYTKKNIKIKII